MGKETVLGRVELHAVFGSEELKYKSEVSRHDLEFFGGKPAQRRAAARECFGLERFPVSGLRPFGSILRDWLARFSFRRVKPTVFVFRAGGRR